MWFILPTIYYCIILMLCGCARFLSASTKMAQRKKANIQQKEGGHLSVEQKVLFCDVTQVNSIDTNKLSCV